MNRAHLQAHYLHRKKCQALEYLCWLVVVFRIDVRSGVQAARVLPLLRSAAHVPDRRVPGRSRHPSWAGAPVGAVTADLAAPPSGGTTGAGNAGAWSASNILTGASRVIVANQVLQVVHRVITRHLLEETGLKAFEAASGAVTLTSKRRRVDRATWPTPTPTPIRMSPARSDRDRRPRVPTALPWSARRAEGVDGARRDATRRCARPGAMCRPSGQQSSTRACAAKRTSASGWNSCAGTSPHQHWPTNGYRSTPPGR